ncbi:alpha/beta family hydrolase [Pseudorhodoplanes sp.]|uniref:alpha/beta hydrolase family protein n=1 Tax=Pseudorhodoplanes sp. TaxID=1934341 RepID=UPI002D0DF749|nr:alpha/beta family hydrolase [Pseudorhodoplanes sp.]HWV54716.1 alpha/beta family hydrolase [Pseudorhodoplanes sp.]
MKMTQTFTIEIPGSGTVSSLLDKPASPLAGYVFAHGAGAGMTHPFMQAVATGLVARNIATLRYQFPYMERGSKRPDAPAVAQAAVRAAVEAAAAKLPGTALIAGGKSFGGRMTSHAQAKEPLPGVRGLCFFGFPLHPAGKPASERGDHLAGIKVPMLFLQGTRDALAEVDLIEPLVASLGQRASLHLVANADHSFHVPAKSGRKDSDVKEEILDTMAAWMSRVLRAT